MYSSGLALWPPDGSFVFVAGQLVFAGLVWTIEQALDRLATQQMLLENFSGVVNGDAPVPDVFWIHDHHGTVAALVQAAGMIDAHAPAQVGFGHALFEISMHRQRIAILSGAPLAGG